MGKKLLRASCLQKSLGGRLILDDISLELREGELVAVCGPSGCGKSTLLNVLGLLEAPDAGELEIAGAAAPRAGTAAASRVVREHIGYLFQNYALVDDLTVEKNLHMALRYSKLGKDARAGLVGRALKRVGLEGREKARVCELSGGEQQRVALARVMVKPGEVVLADEPTGSLDARNREAVVGILRRMADVGKGVLVVTHDGWVAERCDRVLTPWGGAGMGV